MKEKFPLSKEEWYLRRDNRTTRIVGETNSLGDFSIGVIISNQASTSYSTQCMTIIALKMLSNWCRNITVELENTPCLIKNSHTSLQEYVLEMMYQQDPYGNFKISNIKDSSNGVGLAIGPISKTHIDYHWIDSNGWLSGFGYGQYEEFILNKDESNIIGAAFAACLGVSEIFKRAIFSDDYPVYSKWVSLFDFKQLTIPDALYNPKIDVLLDVGKIHQVGCGAVGSSLISLFTLTDWKSELHIVDYDKVEIENCNSSLAFSAYDAYSEKYKVDVGHTILESSSKKSKPYNISYDEFISAGNYQQHTPDIILCLANERNIWATIQNNFPPIVLHGTTNSNWGINFGRHMPLNEWCVMCRFKNEMDIQMVPKCGEGILEENKESESEIFGTLPFLSPACAVLVLAEIAKIAMRKFDREKNFTLYSFKPKTGGEFICQSRLPASMCPGCKDQSITLHQKYAGKSRYWNLTSSVQKAHS